MKSTYSEKIEVFIDKLETMRDFYEAMISPLTPDSISDDFEGKIELLNELLIEIRKDFNLS